MIKVSVVELNSMEGLVMEGRYVVAIGIAKRWLVTMFEEELFWIAVVIGAVDAMRKEKNISKISY